MGLMGVMGRPITIMTSFMPIVVLVVGVSDSIHLLAGFRRERARGLVNRDAVTHSFGALARSCFFTSATTAVGFASLAGTGIALIADFGLFTALAIMLTFVVSMTVLPALLSFLPTTSFDDRGLDVRWIRGVLAAAVRAAGQHPRRAAVTFGVAAIAGLALGSDLRINAPAAKEERLVTLQKLRDSRTQDGDAAQHEARSVDAQRVQLLGQILFDPPTPAVSVEIGV